MAFRCLVREEIVDLEHHLSLLSLGGMLVCAWNENILGTTQPYLQRDYSVDHLTKASSPLTVHRSQLTFTVASMLMVAEAGGFLIMSTLIHHALRRFGYANVGMLQNNCLR